MEGKEWLYGKSLLELESVVSELGLPRFTARQLAEWLYHKQCHSIDEMTNISRVNRTLLSAHYTVGSLPFSEVQTSADGTKKYLFPTLGGQFIESVYIPDRDRATLCVSSEAGCRLGCRFCMTGRQGFQHYLSSGEILNQIREIAEYDQLTNLVYMGMGEPLDNLEPVLKSLEILTSSWGYGWSPTRITLSTVGIRGGLTQFLERSKVHLAVSLHNPCGEERLELMPAEHAMPIAEVVETLERYDFSHQRRLSFEYILFAGVNDTDRHLRALVRLLSGLRCRVNLIRFHRIPDSELTGASETQLVRFRDALNAKGLIATIRASRGEDILAACGLLSTQKQIGISKH